MKITFSAVFGSKNKSRLLEDKGIYIQLYDTHLVSRAYYIYEEPIVEDDDKSGYKTSICNEKTVIRKSSIDKMGVGYDSKSDCYFFGFTTNGNHDWINVESAEKANEALNILKDWWLK